MPDPLSPLVAEFRQALEDCEDVYRYAALACVRSRPEMGEDERRGFIRRMLDLHRGLVLRVFVEVGYADGRWSPEELALAAELFEHVWHKRLDDKQVRVALAHVRDQADLTWDVLLGPFDRLPEFRERADQLETDVLRVANVVAKADGRVSPREVRQLEWLQKELERVLTRLPLAGAADGEPLPGTGRRGQQEAALDEAPFAAPESNRPRPAAPAAARRNLTEVLAELDALVGLSAIKQEVHSLVNFLEMQRARQRFGLPETPVSLHMVFRGNPGTGKTTVARLLGEVFGAMGILSKGHLVETDRSGLVAEYAGQTAPKAHKKIDEALDGVLFIDEAYSLVAEGGEDPYGTEALQVLLKRMEDDRDRLVVILAGYPQPLDRLLRSNPGLSSRFSRQFTFPDYTASELGRIFETLCGRSRYTLPAAARAKLLLGFEHLLEVRDEHFGNGRLARNVFERAVGRLANRIAGVAPLTHALLTTLEADDVAMEGVPASVWAALGSQAALFRASCPGCGQASRVRGEHLGESVQCKRCGETFRMDWAEVGGE